MKALPTLFLFILFIAPLKAQMDASLLKDIEKIEPKVIDWRHYFHQNPELSNREFTTAKKIEEVRKN